MLAVARNNYKISNSYYEGNTSPQANQWIGAMAEQNTAIDANKVTDVVDYSTDVKSDGSRWVLNVKENSSGERFKTSLV